MGDFDRVSISYTGFFTIYRGFIGDFYGDSMGFYGINGKTMGETV